jgi:hypothetical protein
LIYVNRIRVSRGLRISREAKPMDSRSKFLRLPSKESDASAWYTGPDGIGP